MKAIIVAMDKNNGIGANNDMPWRGKIPGEMARFKELTTGNTVVMGRKTFESIGRPLPNRDNIVVSRTPTGVAGVMTANSLASAYHLARRDIFICGGERIYREAMGDMDVLYITEIDAEFPEATVFFPEIDKTVWKEMSREHHGADERNNYAFDFVKYEKL